MNLRQPLKRMALVFGTSALVFITGIGISLLGIELSGGVIEWGEWLANNTFGLRIWRLSLYALAVFCWLRIRRARALPTPQQHRLLRLECAVIALLVLIELQSLGGAA